MIAFSSCDPAYFLLITNNTNEELVLKTKTAIQEEVHPTLADEFVNRFFINKIDSFNYYKIESDDTILVQSGLGSRPAKDGISKKFQTLYYGFDNNKFLPVFEDNKEVNFKKKKRGWYIYNINKVGNSISKSVANLFVRWALLSI